AYSAADVRRIHAAGKKVALMGVENGYGIGTDITNVKKFFDRGARYLALSHDGHNQLTDSNTGDTDNIWKWNGLSPLGKQAVEEANRYGIMMDISHPSKQANLQVMAMSKAPVIASHSGVRALCDHRRNLDDEQLLALKKNGGVVQLVALSAFVKTPIPDSPERAAAVAELRRQSGLGGGPGGARRAGQPNDSAFAAYRAKQAELDAKFPPSPRATVKDFVNHIDYAVKLIGVQHVGIASDFDGGGGVDGYDNASESFNVTMELVRRGYSEQDIIAMWGGNLLRVMAQAEQVARKIQGGK
ncbi:MAG: membrane dipeptidase, partial [Gemmatimonadetes bacterium]|nr:membrane dipeptidase [Gemmatimonadota bacterium]